MVLRNFIIYGGTFDPIHNGHLHTAINVQNHFNFDRFVFLPCKIPVLKNKAVATTRQRIDMIELSLADQDKDKQFAIDLSEINRNSSSYMVHSLENFRQQLGAKVAITLLMGTDSFNQLPQWHDWQQLLSLANLLVIKRSGFEEPPADLLRSLLAKHETQEEKAICEQAQGLIYRYDAGSFNFSSSWIRQQLAASKDLESYLPARIIEYIRKNRIYLEL